jgi:hypothetical protein
VLAMSDDTPASVAEIVVEELRKKEINGPFDYQKGISSLVARSSRSRTRGTFSPATIWNSPACRHVSVCA